MWSAHLCNNFSTILSVQTVHCTFADFLAQNIRYYDQRYAIWNTPRFCLCGKLKLNLNRMFWLEVKKCIATLFPPNLNHNCLPVCPNLLHVCLCLSAYHSVHGFILDVLSGKVGMRFIHCRCARNCRSEVFLCIHCCECHLGGDAVYPDRRGSAGEFLAKQITRYGKGNIHARALFLTSVSPPTANILKWTCLFLRRAAKVSMWHTVTDDRELSRPGEYSSPRSICQLLREELEPWDDYPDLQGW